MVGSLAHSEPPESIAVLCVQQRARMERGTHQGPDASPHGAGPAHLQEVPSRGTHDRYARGEQE